MLIFFLVYTVVFVIIKLVFPRENYVTYIKKRQIIVQTQIPHTKKSKLDHVILTFIL
jgi:exopolysaccharide biosynthesis protein